MTANGIVPSGSFKWYQFYSSSNTIFFTKLTVYCILCLCGVFIDSMHRFIFIVTLCKSYYVNLCIMLWDYLRFTWINTTYQLYLYDSKNIYINCVIRLWFTCSEWPQKHWPNYIYKVFQLSKMNEAGYRIQCSFGARCLMFQTLRLFIFDRVRTLCILYLLGVVWGLW